MLLCYQWSHGSIPVDQARLKLVARGEVSDTVLGLFRDGRCVWLEELRRKRDKSHSGRVDGGRKGALKRWAKAEPKEPEELKLEVQSVPKPKKQVRIPSSSQAIRISKLFGRRLTTSWAEKEIRALRKIQPINDADLDILEEYYRNERAKGDNGFHRRDLYTFLNNYQGELDRAHRAQKTPVQRQKGDLPKGCKMIP